MKKLFFILISTLVMLNSNMVFGANLFESQNLIIKIPLIINHSYKFDPDWNTGNNPSFAPQKNPIIGFDGTATLYLYNQFNELTLNLEENNSIKYSTIVPANTNEVILPNLGSGTYELKLDDGRYEYSCTLEVD